MDKRSETGGAIASCAIAENPKDTPRRRSIVHASAGIILGWYVVQFAGTPRESGRVVVCDHGKARVLPLPAYSVEDAKTRIVEWWKQAVDRGEYPCKPIA